MKARILALGFIATAISAFAEDNDPILMYIGGEPILKSEFEYIYNKNNSSTSIDKKSLNEYIDLFANYKMKVFEAKERLYNERISFQKDIKNYEDQLSAPYLLNQEKEDALIKEAYERMKEQLLVSHILIKVKNNDTITALKKINNIYAKLQSGESFTKLASEYSECPSAKNGGMIGEVVPFSTVYPFETAAYNTEKGKYSKPFRSEFGYHIVFVNDRRPKADKKRIAQIFKRHEDRAKDIADSLFFILKKGAKFEDIAEVYSDDKESAHKGGDLGYLGSRKYADQIEFAAMGLKKEGEITMVSSPFGYHILKLTEIKKLGSYKDNYEAIKKQVERDARSSSVTEDFIDRLINKYNFSMVEGGLDTFSAIAADSTMKYIKAKAITQKLEAPLFIINGKFYPQSEFSDYYLSKVNSYWSLKQKNPDKSALKYKDLNPKDFTNRIFEEFRNKELIELEKQFLLDNYPEYKNLLREYSDGLLLFEISNDLVWKRASSDKAGLAEFFDRNKADYKWERPRFKGDIVYCSDIATYNAVKNLYTHTASQDSFRAIVKRTYNKTFVKLESGVFTKGANKITDRDIFKTGIEYNDVKYPYAFAAGKLTSQPESYEDVKGPVTADYQNYLEEEWIKALRKKYNVRVNQDVLKTIKTK